MINLLMVNFFKQFSFAKLKFKISENNYLLILSAIVGIIVGITAIIFRILLSNAYEFFFVGGTDLIGLSKKITTPLLPAFGGLIVGLIVYKYFHQKGIHGVPSVMRAVATRNIDLHPKMTIKSLSSILTIGFGGSAGPEGPIVEIGSVIGASVGRIGRISRNNYGVLLACGSAAGIAAIFNAPIGGVFFALEIILRDFAIRSFSPVVISSVVAAILSKAYFGDLPAFYVKRALDIKIVSIAEVSFFALLGIICAILSVVFIRLLYKTQDIFSRFPTKNYLKPIVGGLAVGMIGVYVPGILGEGYYGMTEILHSDIGLKLLLIWCVLKIAATSLTLGSGGTGGVFAPALFIGACAGGALGRFLYQFTPNIVSLDAPILYALAGMAGLIAGTLNAPITAILMIFEISGGNYQIVIPLMITVAVSSFMTKSLSKGSIYTLSLLRSGFDVETAAIPNPLRDVVVSTVMKEPKTTIIETDTLPEILNYAAVSDETFFPVLTKDGKFLGILSLTDLRSVLTMGEFGNLLIAKDIADPHPKTLNPFETLEEALNILSIYELEAIPVVDSQAPDKLLGVIKRQDIFSIYKNVAAGKISELIHE